MGVQHCILFIRYWEQGKLTQDLHYVVTITVYKNKRDKADSSNYLEITLLSITEKNIYKYSTELTGTHYHWRTPSREPEL